MVGVRALCGCFVFLLVAVMLLGELDFVTEHIGEPPARRVVDSVLLRSIIGSAWVDRPEQQLLTLRPPDRVRTNVQQEYPPSNTTILAFVNSGYWPWVEHLLNVAAGPVASSSSPRTGPASATCANAECARSLPLGRGFGRQAAL